MAPIMKYFEYEHLPPALKAVSKPIGELAKRMDKSLPDGAEKSAGLRKLLEAKDCLVRARLDADEPRESTLPVSGGRRVTTSGTRCVQMLIRPSRIFVDMDGVVVDFDAYKTKLGLTTGDEVKCIPGAYLEMLPIEGALAGVRSLIGMGYDVWLATKPPTGVAYAYSDKAAWVFKYLPDLKRKLIITHDKGLLGDAYDYLIDDRPHKANCMLFRGRLIHFGSELVKGWSEVLDYFREESHDV